MRIFFLCVAAIFCVPLWTFARLDETEAECLKRYGKYVLHRIDESSTTYEFNKSGYTISLKIYKNKCIYIRYKRLDNAKFEKEEIKTIMKINSTYNSAFGEWREDTENRSVMLGKAYTLGTSTLRVRDNMLNDNIVEVYNDKYKEDDNPLLNRNRQQNEIPANIKEL